MTAKKDWDMFCQKVNRIVDEELVEYADAGTHGVFVSPTSLQTIVSLFKLAKKHSVNIFPMGNERRIKRQNVPLDKKTMMLGLKNLNQIIQLDNVSRTVRVQAGVVGQDLEDTLNKHDYTLGDFPKGMLKSTVGGMLSVRTSGKLSRRHGTLEDSVVGLTVLSADGHKISTHLSPRRSSGPDLARFFCGSEGMLGIITECTLKIHKVSETHLLTAWKFESTEHALLAARLAIREEACPSEMEVYSGRAAALKVPELGDQGSASFLFAATSGPTDLANCDRELLQSAALAAGGEKVENACAESWWNALSSNPLDGKQAFQCACTPGHQASLLQALEKHTKENQEHLLLLASQFDIDGAVFYISLQNDEATSFDMEANLDSLKEVAKEHGAMLTESKITRQESQLQALRQLLDSENLFGRRTLLEQKQS